MTSPAVLRISFQHGILRPRLLPSQDVLQLPQRRGRGNPAPEPAAVAAVDHDFKGRRSGVLEVHLWLPEIYPWPAGFLGVSPNHPI